jgi:transposase
MIERTPHYNSIFNVLDKESLTPVLQELIRRSAEPLRSIEGTFAADSTGFGLQSFYRHFSAKYGRDQYTREWMKLHVMVGTNTNVITSAIVTDRNHHDSPQLPRLLAETTENCMVSSVCADKGYSSHDNIGTITSFGAEPFVAFTVNATGKGKPSAWTKAFHYFQLNRQEFLAKYHRRSNVESTFSAIKRKFGDTLRSKTRIAQRNELLLKCLCHNLVCLIHELHDSPRIAKTVAQKIGGLPTKPLVGGA